jgi:predicted transcriptional regulator
MSSKINAFDFDGVVSLGINPGKTDIIITGRCLDESSIVYEILNNRGIYNQIYFNQSMSTLERGTGTIESRVISGKHKVRTLEMLINNGYEIELFFEDDPIQSAIIKDSKLVNVIDIQHNNYIKY